MNEFETIVREVDALGELRGLLATVVRVNGSSYRRAGARMLVANDRWVSGCISGGCLERDVMLRGWHRCREGAVLVRYDSTTEEGEPWATGLGCGGTVDVLLEPLEAGSRNDALAFAAACFAREREGILVTIVESSVAGAPVGARIAIGPDVGFTKPVTDVAIRTALEHAASRGPGVVEIAGVTALVERVAPSPQLFVLGSGHDVVPVVDIAGAAGFRVTVADRSVRDRSRFAAAQCVLSLGDDRTNLAARIDAAREPYVLIMHHHVDADRAALAMALDSRARYIGVLGPARRTRALLDELRRGADSRLHAPVGLDIGAETPSQIALATVSEMCAVAMGAGGGKIRERKRAIHASVATIVLAAGGANRFGSPKQLAPIDGVAMIRVVAAQCLAANAGPVCVVVGANGREVADALRGLPITVIDNDGWREGIASSIRAAVAWAESSGCDALLIALGDQPRVPREHLVALREAWIGGAPVAGTRWREAGDVGDEATVIGPPGIFDRARWSDLARLEGDRGAASLLREDGVATIECAAARLDVDTPADLPAAGVDRRDRLA